MRTLLLLAAASLAVAACSSSSAQHLARLSNPAPKEITANGPSGRTVTFRKVDEFTAKVAVYEGTVRQGRIERKITLYKVGNLFFASPWEFKDHRFTPVISASSVKVVPLSKEELAEFKSAVKKLQDYGVKYPETGKPKLYVIFDAFCPFCKRGVQSGRMKELMKKYDLVLVPLNVHGKASEKENACLIEKARKEPMTQVVKEWFTGKLPKCSPSEKAVSLEKEVSKELIKLGLTATPTFVAENGKVYVGRLPKGGK